MYFIVFRNELERRPQKKSLFVEGTSEAPVRVPLCLELHLIQPID